MKSKTPIYWTVALIVFALAVLALGNVEQPMQILQLAGNNTTGATP